MASWNKLDGVKAIVETGIKRLPEFYIRPEEERSTSNQLYDLEVIDISGLGGEDGSVHSSVIRKIEQASQELGFFQVANHGVDIELMDRMLHVSLEFFDMPLEEKMMFYTTDVNAPVRYATSFNPLKEKVLDWSDHFVHRFLPEHKEPHPWPQKPSAYREIAEEYLKQVGRVAKRLNAALSEALGLDKNYLEEAFGKHQVSLGLNYYPPCPQPELALGLSGHSDVGGMTLLLQNNVPGLQVKVEGEWRTVRPVPGALIINISDQTQFFSNGRFKSIEHRAIVNSEKPRISVGVFWDPAPDVVVAPIPQLLNADNPPLFLPNRYEEYVKNLFSRELVGKSWVEKQKVKPNSTLQTSARK